MLWNKQKKKKPASWKNVLRYDLFVLRLIFVCLCMRACVHAARHIRMLDADGEAEPSWGKERNDSESSSRCMQKYWIQLYNRIHNRGHEDNLKICPESHESTIWCRICLRIVQFHLFFHCLCLFLLWAKHLRFLKGFASDMEPFFV